MKVAGVVLCGGESRRMGRSKATLPFGDETMLTRVIRLLRDVVEPIVVVAAPRQELPELSSEVQVVRDRMRGRGPLEGVFCGLEALHERASVAYVTACDVPLLRAAFVRSLIEKLGRHDVVVPVEDRFYHPLAAVYRTSLTSIIADRLERGELRIISFYEQVATCRVDVNELRDVDPDLRSLMNLNGPEDYRNALRIAGITS